MSIEIMSLVLNHSKATGRAKLVLMGIANHQGDQGSWPSIATLARYANASEASVHRDIRLLQELGELRVELQAAPTNTKYKTNLYWVIIDPKTDESLGVSNSVGVSDSTLRGVKSDSLGVSPSDGQNIIRNLKKPNLGFNENWQPSEQQKTELQKKYPSANLDQHLQEMILYIIERGEQAKVKSMPAKFSRWMINADKYAKGALSQPAPERKWEWG